MKITQLSTPFLLMEVLEYMASGNTVIKRKKRLQQLKGSLYRDEGKQYKGSSELLFSLYLAYPEHQSIAVWFCDVTFRKEDTIEKTYAMYISDLEFSDDYWRKIDNNLENGGYIRNIDIELSRLVRPNKTLYYVQKQHNYREERKRKDTEKREKQLMAYQLEVERGNETSYEIISSAVSTIVGGGEIPNESIKIWKIADKYPEYKEYCLINHLANLYGVTIPIKVKGWITSKLHSVTIKDGKAVSYLRYVRDSTTFIRYMNMLTATIIRTEKDRTDKLSS